MIDWAIEQSAIAAAAAMHRVDPDFIEAIRVAENGGPGREFGVLSEPAETYDEQLRVTCVSVAHRLSEYSGNPLLFLAGRSRYRREFVSWFSGKWAPAGAEHDPQHMNLAWFRNAWKAYSQRVLGG